jgi:transcriptional regulator with XRE-family HTH domain
MSRRYRNCIGPRVRELRMSKSLTQDQFAAHLQLAGLHTLDRVAVAKIESQLRSVFDYELAVIARELGVDPTKLLPAASVLRDDLDDLISGKR